MPSSHMHILRMPTTQAPPPNQEESCTSIHDLACTRQFAEESERLAERRESAMERLAKVRATMRLTG